MEIQQIQVIRKYSDLLFRKKAFIAFFLLIGMVAGLFYYLSQPKIYTASALLSYQQQSVNPARMSPDEEEHIRDIVSTLTDIVTSRSSLESIIEDLDLYPQARQVRPMEDVINMMRERIEISPSRRGNTFSVTVTGTDPQKTTRVANVLASRFIEENLQYREERASETFAYSQDELDMAKQLLDQKEAGMRDYTLKYFNEMPEQRANNMDRLNALQDQYQDRQNSIQELKRTAILVQDQIIARKRIVEENEQLRLALISQRDADRAAEESVFERIERLSTELSSLRNRYTELHPEIRRLSRQLEHLQQLAASENAEGSGAPGSSGATIDQDLIDLQIQQKEIRLSVDRLEKEQANILKEINKYERWIEATPVRGAEWSALTREHGELRRHYDFLVAQNLQAQSALNLERRQKGSQFTVEDLAREPQRPTKPDFKTTMMMALLLGLAVGGGLVIGIDLIDASFRDPTELEDSLGVELICIIPKLAIKSEQRKKTVIAVCGYVVFFFCLAGVFAAMAYYYKAGDIII